MLFGLASRLGFLCPFWFRVDGFELAAETSFVFTDVDHVFGHGLTQFSEARMAVQQGDACRGGDIIRVCPCSRLFGGFEECRGRRGLLCGVFFLFTFFAFAATL